MTLFGVFEICDQDLANFDQILTQNLVNIDQNCHLKSLNHEYSQNAKFHWKMLLHWKVMDKGQFKAIKTNIMAAL